MRERTDRGSRPDRSRSRLALASVATVGQRDRKAEKEAAHEGAARQPSELGRQATPPGALPPQGRAGATRPGQELPGEASRYRVMASRRGTRHDELLAQQAALA